MRIVLNLKWAGITPALYDQIHDIVRWEENIAPGGVFHVASFDDKGMRVTDVWESPEDFNRFVETRLMPAVAKLGITSQPVVEISPLHRVFVPALARK